MRADDLHEAVGRIAGVLDHAGIRPALDRFRAARGDERSVAAARLERAGKAIGERFRNLDTVERRLVKSLHLDSLADPAYWQALLGTAETDDKGRAELVRLAARLMFAAQNLPGLTVLLSDVEPSERLASLGSGESRLRARLVDASERASSPDRIARAIDGIDMLYSACASIARRPAMDLRLDAIDGTDSRDVHFTGGRDAVAAVVGVVMSIPNALRSIDAGSDLDLDALVSSLPIFADLQALASMGTFSAEDLSNIGETMHQGALLVMESGIVLMPASPPSRAGPGGPGSSGGLVDPVDPVDPVHGAGAVPRDVAADRHYDAYLREREAMRAGEGIVDGEDESASNDPASDHPSPEGEPSRDGESVSRNSVELAKARLGTTVEQDRARRGEVDRMLSVLKGQRGGH